jgi:osmotically-inducible protein OsmY
MEAGMSWAGKAALLALSAVAFAGPALAASDAELKSRIEERFAKAGLAQNADIRVSVEDGVVDRVINTVRVVPEAPRPDKAIKADVEAAILRWERYGPFDAVGVEVKGGVVRLTGWVDEPWKRDEIEDRVARVDGMRDVLADLRVQGFSSADVQLRSEIFARIYGDPLFERYTANPVDPPVRVYVLRGRVTLVGKVSSKVEQAVVGHIARSTLAFAVDNQVQVEGEKAREEDRKKDPDEG